MGSSLQIPSWCLRWAVSNNVRRRHSKHVNIKKQLNPRPRLQRADLLHRTQLHFPNESRCPIGMGSSQLMVNRGHSGRENSHRKLSLELGDSDLFNYPNPSRQWGSLCPQERWQIQGSRRSKDSSSWSVGHWFYCRAPFGIISPKDDSTSHNRLSYKSTLESEHLPIVCMILCGSAAHLLLLLRCLSRN